MNVAQADKAAAQAELKSLPKINRLTETEIRKLIESLGDIRAVLAAGDPAEKARLHRALALEVRYQHRQQLAIVGATPCGVSTGVRRGSGPLRTRASSTTDPDPGVRARRRCLSVGMVGRRQPPGTEGGRYRKPDLLLFEDFRVPPAVGVAEPGADPVRVEDP